MLQPSGGPPPWVQDAVFYQIFPDRFYNGDPRTDPADVRPWEERPTRTSFSGGDLSGILKRLDYLKDLGVTALYLTPIFKAPSNHKYDVEDYYQIDPHFGDLALLKELVQELHRHKMRLILDGVFNHCGLSFFAFQEVLEKGPRSPYWEWFVIEGFPIVTEPEPNYHCWAGVAQMPEFNLQNPAVRQYLLEVVRYWLREADMDGWRLDTVEYLDPSFVREIRRAAKAVKPDAYVLGEVMGTAAAWFKGGCLDAAMNYRLWELLVAFFAEGRLTAEEFDHGLRFLRRSYPDWANYAMYNLLGSHDKPRFRTLCHGDLRRVRLASAFLFTYLGVPAVYYGDEVGLEGGEDPDCRRTFPWTTLESDPMAGELLAFYKRLIRLRRHWDALRRGVFRTLHTQGPLFAYGRVLRDQVIWVVLNNGPQSARLARPTLTLEGQSPTWDLWAEEPLPQGSHLELEPFGFRLLAAAFASKRGGNYEKMAQAI